MVFMQVKKQNKLDKRQSKKWKTQQNVLYMNI